MPGILTRLQAAYSAFRGDPKGAFKAFDQGNWIDSNAPGNILSSSPRTGRMHWIPGTSLDWDSLAGPLWLCPAVQACLNWIFRNFPQAPPIVEKMDGKGEWSRLPDHPLLALLTRPNPSYDWTMLAQGLVLSLEVNGNGYLVIERAGNGKPAELWWTPHDWIKPYTAPGNDPRVIDAYDYHLGWRFMRIPPEDVVHLTYGRDPADPRLGMSPLASASRDVSTLQQSGNYRPNILRNFGVIGKFISPKDSATAEKVQFDPAEISKHVDSRSQGDAVGGTVTFDFPADVQFPKVTPQDMALDTLEDRPEADICALIGIPVQVTGLHAGREAKTYANMREAREAAWEEKLIPLGAMLSAQIGHRLLPEFEKGDAAKIMAAVAGLRMGFDYSDIRPLQPDRDALHARYLKDWLGNLITLGEWYQKVGEPEPTDLPDWKTVKLYRYKDLGGQPQLMTERTAQESSLGESTTPAPKMMTVSDILGDDWVERVNADLNALALTNGNGHR